jgi:hypothetical protein
VSDVVRDQHSKRTTLLRTASSPGTKTPSASFKPGIRDHSCWAPKDSNDLVIAYNGRDDT